MNSAKLKRFFSNFYVIMLLVVLLFGVVAIHPSPDATGVTIRSVMKNSSAYNAGIASPDPGAAPTSKEAITAINSQPVKDVESYYQILSAVPDGTQITLTTSKHKTYLLTKTSDDIGISVYNAPKSNIRLGLDLQGGTRVVLQPEEKVSEEVLESLITSLKQRLNVYGLSDLNVRKSADLSGNQFVVVEVAGANEQEVKELLSTQGKFEASIGNKTVFKGGNDITYVCRTADCSGIDPYRGCFQIDGGYACSFRFSISLSPEAAQRQADITQSLAVVAGEGGQTYLNESLDLFLDDQFVQTLNIGSDLRGRAVTDIEISGSGTGLTQNDALNNALSEMKSLQTILITGSLPVKLNIVKTDSISPSLGQEFTKNAVWIGLLSILAVSLIVFIRYRRLVLVLPILLMGWVEIFLTIAYAALIGWNLDVPSIAGIIIAIGTGINDQILITDETIRGEKEEAAYTLKDKIKRAFFIVMASYFTSIASLGPLLFAGAGLLKGFAITSLIGLTLGVLITRPAYAHIIEVLLKE